MVLVMGLPWFQVAKADLNEGLVAHYPFNGNANDESGNGNDGTVIGASLTEDRFGNVDSAYFFNENGDKITAEDIPDLQFGTQAFAISTWVMTTQTGIWKRIVTRRSATTSGFWYSLAMTNNKARFEIAAGVELDSIRNINDGNWHFVAVTRDISTGLFSMYVDGQLESQLADQGDNLTNTGNIPLEIGIWNTEGYGATFNGLIDDVRIYNRTLSKCEIQSLYTGEDECAVCIAPLDIGGEGCYQHKTQAWCTANEGAWHPELSCKADFPELPLSVTIESFSATRNGSGKVKIKLATGSETETAALHIYRAPAILQNLQQIQNICSWDGAGTEVSGSIYSCKDENAPANVVYWPAEVENNGVTNNYLEFMTNVQ
jgi:hypothetical protein